MPVWKNPPHPPEKVSKRALRALSVLRDVNRLVEMQYTLHVAWHAPFSVVRYVDKSVAKARGRALRRLRLLLTALFIRGA